MANQAGTSLAGRDYFHGNWSTGTCIIGGFIILIALISGGMVGFGDGLLILTMGSVLGAGELAGILCGALLLCGIYSGIEYLMLKKSRSEEIPFVPFLLIGYLGGIFL